MDRSASRRRIRIVTGYPGPLEPHYYLHHLASAWRAAGETVEVGPCERLAEDALGLLHIDKTRVPPEVLPQRPAGVPLLNGRVLDISKRLVSRERLGPEDSWDGQVIVKTDENNHGLPERGGRRGLGERLLAPLPWRLTRQLPFGRYPILRRLSAVPDWVWRRPDLLVERFTPEREDGLYALRIWLFFGRRNVLYRILSPDPLVKASAYLRLEASHEPPPPEIEAERQRLGFDFGKLDFVIHEGRPILLDANKTPAWTGNNAERVAHLAGGLEDYLAGRLGAAA